MLALVLGLTTWWGLAWLLSPRPLYTLRFPITDLSGISAPARFHLNSLDREGRLFSVFRRTLGDNNIHQIDFDINDCPTGKLLRSYPFTQQGAMIHSPAFPDDVIWDINRGDVWTTFSQSHYADPSGVLYLKAYRPGDNSDNLNQVWAWNLLTGQLTLLRSWKAPHDFKFNRDGATGIEQCSLPSLPLHIPCLGDWLGTTLANLAPARLNKEFAPLLIRQWTLPDFQLRSAILVPKLGGNVLTVYSSDGNWCVVATTGKYAPGYAYEVRQQKVDVYDLRKGRLHLTINIEVGEVMDVHCVGSDFIEVGISQDLQFTQGNRPQHVASYRSHRKTYHLASGRWIQLEKSDNTIDRSMKYPDKEGLSRFMTSLSHESRRQTVNTWECDKDGNTRQIAETNLEYASFIPNTDQVLGYRVTTLQLPEWLKQLTAYIPPLHDRLLREQREIVLLDYVARKVLWSTPVDQYTHWLVTAAGKHFILVDKETTEHVVRVFALSLSLWSPWWPRAAGLLITLALCWFLLRPPVCSHHAPS